MSMKRKILDSGSSPCLRRSKRLAALSLDQSTEGRDEDENNVRFGGESEDMSNSISHGDNDSDGDTGSHAGSDGERDSEGAMKLPNLSSFRSRPVIEERSVAIG
ncbi:hypothetical protein RHMOL_Rhmol04G0314200 [Rhododendron molle]|uniref:Uncharacterized protein n=1 Tax=Rhododendron molle TaxID=49168 RepID=A0ACC0P641_RHOML|nr:hypothetical protein RHMOL_Rhmol04G0314200 [Rhododendron molle]